jgi:AmmeMemoRadiSam system protein A
VQSHLSAHSLELPEIRDEVLLEPRGLFVSIHEGNALRGCIGNIQPSNPLYVTTANSAIAAAVSDPRFPPMTLDELPHVDFELSVLGPIEQVTDVESIEIGRHGLIVSKGNAKGLLLPQVASQYRWNRERFLAETCRKAGLRPEDRQNVQIYRFTAEVFGEK